mmetsp:Transcript_79290/g.245898  ORF Transcript_79290/g.245898 Transcript_79290/m.245898 type:complete len:535 (+) Transcript_79290:206-1810(+)
MRGVVVPEDVGLREAAAVEQADTGRHAGARADAVTLGVAEAAGRFRGLRPEGTVDRGLDLLQGLGQVLRVALQARHPVVRHDVRDFQPGSGLGECPRQAVLLAVEVLGEGAVVAGIGKAGQDGTDGHVLGLSKSPGQLPVRERQVPPMRLLLVEVDHDTGKAGARKGPPSVVDVQAAPLLDRGVGVGAGEGRRASEPVQCPREVEGRALHAGHAIVRQEVVEGLLRVRRKRRPLRRLRRGCRQQTGSGALAHVLQLPDDRLKLSAVPGCEAPRLGGLRREHELAASGVGGQEERGAGEALLRLPGAEAQVLAVASSRVGRGVHATQRRVLQLAQGCTDVVLRTLDAGHHVVRLEVERVGGVRGLSLLLRRHRRRLLPQGGGSLAGCRRCHGLGLHEARPRSRLRSCRSEAPGLLLEWRCRRCSPVLLHAGVRLPGRHVWPRGVLRLVHELVGRLPRWQERRGGCLLLHPGPRPTVQLRLGHLHQRHGVVPGRVVGGSGADSCKQQAGPWKPGPGRRHGTSARRGATDVARHALT